jgi:hypothetical protein
MGWTAWRDQGLTRHENWWPAVYRQYCESQCVEPDKETLAYGVTYETTRADLRDVSASG